MCIRGLQQYGLAYEEAFEQADELQQIYNHTRTLSSVNRECLLPVQSMENVPSGNQVRFRVFSKASVFTYLDLQLDG